MKVRWGILSTANIARTEIIPAIKRTENAELVGIASRDEKVYRIAKELDIPKVFFGIDSINNMKAIQSCYNSLNNQLDLV